MSLNGLHILKQSHIEFIGWMDSFQPNGCFISNFGIPLMNYDNFILLATYYNEYGCDDVGSGGGEQQMRQIFEAKLTNKN